MILRVAAIVRHEQPYPHLEGLRVRARERERLLAEGSAEASRLTADLAAGRCEDLVAEMKRQLTRDIMMARNRLDAIRWRPAPADNPADGRT